MVDPLMEWLGEKKMHTYGVPMDCSTNFTGGPTWLAMQAASGFHLSSSNMARASGQALLESVFRYVNDTANRLPLVDFHHVDTAEPRSAQRARPAVGAVWAAQLVAEAGGAESARPSWWNV